MRILIVNKFLYLNGGSETYIYKIGKQLEAMGHEVEYFGMEDERNVMGNSLGEYTSKKEFRSGITFDKLLYPFEIIYSLPAKKKIKRVIEEFKPDVVHLNNINFQITPSVITEIKKHNIPIVWTAHDYQLICPAHLLYIMHKGEVCEKCVSGSCRHCFSNKCIHGSAAQSALAMLEGQIYKIFKIYGKVDKIICPSEFLKNKIETRAELKGKCTVMHNFVEAVEQKKVEKEDYVLYFGRFDKEKGIKTLIECCKKLENIKFVFAGSGELEAELENVANIENVGFKTGEELEMLIRKALFTVSPSECYENCPFSVIESQMYAVPVVGADIGGIPELIKDGKTGLLFESGNADELSEKINQLWSDRALLEKMSENCVNAKFDDVKQYCENLIKLYKGQNI